MISADRLGVSATTHVPIKKTQTRLIAFEPAKDVFVKQYLRSAFTKFGRLKASRTILKEDKINTYSFWRNECGEV